MAQLVELQNKKDEAKTNYVWTLSKLDEKQKKEPENLDLKELYGLTNYLYVSIKEKIYSASNFNDTSSHCTYLLAMESIC